jgi:hypothetical protein
MSDALPDRYDAHYSLAADQPDTDGDGLTDGYDLVRLGAGVLAADAAR